MNNEMKPKIDFPVNFDLKVIMEMKVPLEENRQALVCIFESLCIQHFEWRTRFSSERNYVSFSVNVLLESQEKMDRLYEEMKKLPQIRFAV